MNKHIALTILIVIAHLLVSCSDPPVKEEVEVEPQNYLKVNPYVKDLREEFLKEGRITAAFLPSQIDTGKTVEYLYWYNCAILGNPNYAVTVTVQFLTDETLQDEIVRIKELEGFTELIYNDYVIIEGKGLSEKLKGFFEPPVLDGSRYVMEYAIVSTKNRTMTYSEICIWENQRVQEKIDAQLNLLYRRDDA